MSATLLTSPKIGRGKKVNRKRSSADVSKILPDVPSEDQAGTTATSRPGTPQPGTPQPGTPQPGTPQPGSRKTHTKQPASDEEKDDDDTRSDNDEEEEKTKSTRKFTRRKWKESLHSAGSLMDEIVKFTTQKAGHWALVIEDSADQQRKGGEFVFEISKLKPDEQELPVEGRVDAYKMNPDSLPPPGFHSEKEDRYNDDEDYPERVDKTLYMRASKQIRKGFEEPNYKLLGGVCWDLLDRLKCKTKFTNGEIWHEAQRIWHRQHDYRYINNNCQRFCILLAISIRSKQNATLRILNGKIAVKQKLNM
ncbi:hypothetical protein DFP73DRAFT_629848 [Morchella snyderi]|nr:hypothetical protein DFP73DRAFT_629848 [Morchella snyderi]